MRSALRCFDRQVRADVAIEQLTVAPNSAHAEGIEHLNHGQITADKMNVIEDQLNMLDLLVRGVQQTVQQNALQAADRNVIMHGCG